MIREEIKRDLLKIIGEKFPSAGINSVEVTRTADAKFGDFATTAAFGVNKSQRVKEPKEPKGKQTPMEVARILADSLSSLPYVEKLEVKEPGFLNFFIKSEVWQNEVENVLNLAEKYGSNNLGKGKKARVEFVSANPTGPLHFGNARGGPIGDSIASVLEFCEYEVLREYYHNDVGEQVRKLGESIVNVASGEKLEDQEYKGEYVRDLAKEMSTPEGGPVTSFPPASARLSEIDSKADSEASKLRADGIPSRSATPQVFRADEAGKKAVAMMLEEILEDCRAMGIEFGKVYSESELIEKGKTKEVIDFLDSKGVLKQKEGALWFAPSDEFLKDRETVVVKTDKSFTYFANDIAYHRIKFEEGGDLVIDVMGANHHGHVPRLKAAISALGFDVSKFHVILYQWVRFKKAGKILNMSKRSGTFITAREILEEIGKDALRFFILMHDPNSPIDFDLDLAKEKSNKNPVYYVQYAYARISSILEKTNDKSLTTNANYGFLASPYELALIKQITRLEEIVAEIGESFAVHRLTTYATELADSFHKFYENCRVLDEKDEVLQAARIDLILATKIALANTLKLLGVSAPERM